LLVPVSLIDVVLNDAEGIDPEAFYVKKTADYDRIFNGLFKVQD
jgi:hypothetical protein